MLDFCIGRLPSNLPLPLQKKKGWYLVGGGCKDLMLKSDASRACERSRLRSRDHGGRKENPEEGDFLPSLCSLLVGLTHTCTS